MYTPQEAYGAVAGEMYYPGELGYVEPQDVLDDLDPDVVKAAKQYADETGAAWPPAPSGGIFVQIASL